MTRIDQSYRPLSLRCTQRNGAFAPAPRRPRAAPELALCSRRGPRLPRRNCATTFLSGQGQYDRRFLLVRRGRNLWRNNKGIPQTPSNRGAHLMRRLLHQRISRTLSLAVSPRSHRFGCLVKTARIRFLIRSVLNTDRCCCRLDATLSVRRKRIDELTW